ncbi:hypothetical protein B7W89_07700 [Agrobacterium tumefaciens]|uniref:STM4504/CBY_0614 family protein n=1 Tax=Agrobacterium tumefaciens TaxID=358 RepID=UPI000B6E9EF7|nr:hypothetical protein [Agrobacterium tumefaciens]NSY01185.1 hypothetical protein [Agrobacterium tumefaciens]OVE92251.1 hypothetical protein B7W89_07700 [Agrobacterium tumefaciens]
MIFELYSKRAAKKSGNVVDVYEYENIPQKLKVQTVQIFDEIFGNPDDYYRSDERAANVHRCYEEVVKILRREHGVMRLSGSKSYDDDFRLEYLNYILSSETADLYLDAVEVGIAAVNVFCRSNSYRALQDAADRCDEAIKEINYRIKENGLGFEWLDDQIVRIDSELVHAEIVKPALSFLNGAMYAGPRQEFLGAHKHYRAGEHKQAIVDCLKAFESTMKAICDKRGWTYDKGRATAKDLITICFDKGLVPSYWQNNLANLKALLESGVPTGRNKNAGHGQGATPVDVDDSVAEYIMHMTASTILFLAKSEKELP